MLGIEHNDSQIRAQLCRHSQLAQYYITKEVPIENFDLYDNVTWYSRR
jgi:hypothetical protein